MDLKKKTSGAGPFYFLHEPVKLGLSSAIKWQTIGLTVSKIRQKSPLFTNKITLLYWYAWICWSSFWRAFFVYIAKSYMQYKNKISIWGGRKSDDRNQRRGYINKIVKEANDTALQGQSYVVRSTWNELWRCAMLIMSYCLKEWQRMTQNALSFMYPQI